MNFKEKPLHFTIIQLQLMFHNAIEIKNMTHAGLTLNAQEVRILFVEDNPADAELMAYELHEGGFDFVSSLVMTRDDYISAINDFHPDIILSDYDLPSFCGWDALKLKKKLCPDIPFILVTGAIGEERAIEVLTGGATDYVLKRNLSRLVPAVWRALEEAFEHKKRKEVEAERDGLLEHLERLVQEKTAELQAEIAKQKQMETQLRESRDKYQALIETSDDHIWEMDAAGRFIYCSPQIERLWGIKPEDMIGRTPFSMMPHQYKTTVEESFARVAKEAKPFKKLQAVSLDGGGRLVHIELGGVPFFDVNGKLLGYRGTTRNITEHKLAEEKRERLMSELEAANKDLESFAYSVSHDLRAPLRAIDGYSSMLIKTMDGKLDGEQKRRFDLIKDNVRHMNHLIDDLLALSRAGRSAITCKTIDMNRLAKSVWDQQVAANPEVSVACRIADLPEANGDGSLIFQVFSNLLSNAVKYSRKRKKPSIEIGGESNSGGSVYYVKDNGIGFSMRYYDKLFGVFQRLHSNNQYEGTGVGLAIVQRIIHRHGGQVWAEGRVGQGAKFYFSLPK